MSMRILFVYPAPLENGKPVKYKKAYMPPLIFAFINRLTPDHHSIIFINELVEDIDYSILYDFVAISAMTIQAERAYQIADKFRARDINVVIGGIHATVLPQEAKQHADAVAIGEADNIWEQILNDCEHNRLKDFYQDTEFPDLQKLIIPKWNNINLRIYPKRPNWKLPVIPVFATRGCPFGCKFCSVTKIFGKTFRTKPIDNIIQEIDAIKADHYFFIDDNITFNPDYSRELFKALSKKNIKWMSQTSTTILKNPDLIDLAAKSNCSELVIGVESINRDSLASARKEFNRTEEYEELFRRLLRAGIMPMLSFIFGFDKDTPEQFQLTLDFLKKNKIYYALFWILTPFPGTDLFDEMKQAGRINNYNWSDYRVTNVVFKPKNFTEQQLYDLYWNTFQEFYSCKNIIPHALNGLKTKGRSLSVFFDNLFYQPYFMHQVKSHIHPYSGGFGKRII
jgi:radical SAM superfamily enzyme YgiQ (UPF0313 family)